MKKLLPILLLLTVALPQNACKSSKNAKPEASYNTSFKPQPSVINVPVSISRADLEQNINAQVNGLLYEDNSLTDNGGDNTMIKAWKNGDIKLDLSGNYIDFTVPISFWLKTGVKLEKLGLNLSRFEEVEGALSFKFRTEYDIEADWDLSTQTSPMGYEWVKKPTINIVGFKLPVTFIADRLVEGAQKMVSTQLDKLLAENFSLRNQVQVLWEMLNEPILLDSENSLWLSLTPQQVTLAPVYARQDSLQTMLSVKTLSEAKMGHKPATRKVTAVPEFILASPADEDFSISISAAISYAEAERLARQYMVGETYTSGKKSVTVRNIDLYGKDDRLIVDAQVDGSLNGNIYLTALPFFNPATGSIEMQNINFELETDKFLQKTAAWLLKAPIKNKLKSKMVFPLKDELQAAKQAVQSYLDDYSRPMDGISLSGKLNDISIGQIYLSPEAINVVVQSKGNIKVKLGMF